MRIFLQPVGARIQPEDSVSSDMGYYSLRVQTWGGIEHIQARDGNRVACEFMVMTKNTTNNEEGDILLWDMQELHKNGYNLYCLGDVNGMTRRLPATLDSIKMVLEELTGNNIELEILSRGM